MQIRKERRAGIRDQRKTQDYPDHSTFKINKNTKNPRDYRRLAVIQDSWEKPPFKTENSHEWI